MTLSKQTAILGKGQCINKYDLRCFYNILQMKCIKWSVGMHTPLANRSFLGSASDYHIHLDVCRVSGEATNGSLLPGNNLSWDFPHLLGPRCAPLCFFRSLLCAKLPQAFAITAERGVEELLPCVRHISLETAHFCWNVLREGSGSANICVNQVTQKRSDFYYNSMVNALPWS